MPKPIMSFCSKTVQHFRKLLEYHSAKTILVGVQGGGCNGLKYYVEPSNEKPKKLDEQIQIDGVDITICGNSLLHLIGTEVEWNESPMGSGLEFINPNASSTCGCGDTFQTKY